MNFIKKQTLKTLFLFFFSVSFSQTTTSDSLRGEFTYLLQYKPNTLNQENFYKELFTMQISDKRAFFISENRLKFDSLFMEQYNKNRGNFNIDMRGFPSSKFKFLIIQTNDNSQFYESVGTALLSYNTPIIQDWKLSNETKIINSIQCKKAEVSYKGREWTAWYSTEIPFPYGPYKFSGLPGLIVKITDKTGDYDFELVKSVSSSKLRRGGMITINKRHYQNAKLVTKEELTEATTNYRNNIKYELEKMGTVFSEDQKRQKINEKEKKGYNPIELE
ncbi:GLPGLI family protein [Chryseobacterium sp. G0186]|uniref:GLPGLI family protein n=1 Tax=Chryseobacterium sp. G0186 TaxID=2487064 RepID=UPI000F5097B2|nr:GLPGLI family protein [Chryseobacterium sp. G0186]AZA79575.1 GLPGLI family protein [Chryseobacterium sp. G0186]